MVWKREREFYLFKSKNGLGIINNTHAKQCGHMSHPYFGNITSPVELLHSWAAIFFSILHHWLLIMTYTWIGCYATFNQSCSLEAHKWICHSHKTKSGKLKNLIWTLSLSAHTNHVKTSGSATPSIHHEIPGQPELPGSPEKNNEIDLNLDEQPVSNCCFY